MSCFLKGKLLSTGKDRKGILKGRSYGGRGKEITAIRNENADRSLF
jgi:hypothetical protein